MGKLFQIVGHRLAVGLQLLRQRGPHAVFHLLGLETELLRLGRTLCILDALTLLGELVIIERIDVEMRDAGVLGIQ